MPETFSDVRGWIAIKKAYEVRDSDDAYLTFEEFLIANYHTPKKVF